MQPNTPNVVDFPDNILQNIAVYCFTERVVFPLRQDEPRRLLSQVCSKWRSVIISTPPYWHAIDLAPTLFRSPEHARILAPEFLQRSRNLPLSFSFSTVIRGGEVDPKSLVNDIRARHNLVRQFLILCDSRLQSLTCTLGEGEVSKLFNKRSFPILDNIDITVIAETNLKGVRTFPENQPFEFNAFQTSPSLRKMTLSLFVSPRPIELHFPWNLMTKIHLEHSPISVEYFVWTMKISRCLQDVFLHLTFDTSSKERRRCQLQKTELPNLRLLRLKLIEPRKYPSLFTLFHLPVLAELWLDRGDAGMRRDMDLYAPLLSGSRNTLKRMILNEFTLSEPVQSSTPHLQQHHFYQNVDGLLRISQNITALHLSTGVDFNPTTLERLSTGELLPTLDTLAIGTLYGWDVISMVERRNTICKRGISSSTSSGPPLCALANLYVVVFAHDMDLAQRGELEVAVAGLNLALYRLRFVYQDANS